MNSTRKASSFILATLKLLLAVAAAVEPPPIVQVSYRVASGETVTLGCTYTASPPPVSVRWALISNGETKTLTTDNFKYSGSTPSSPSLVVKNVTKKDVGSYICYVENSAGTGCSLPISLTVTAGNPSVIIPKPVYQAEVGSPIIIKCNVVSELPIVRVIWYKETEEIIIDNQKYFGGSTSSPSLVIASCEKEADEGEYVCEAQNEEGKGRSILTKLEVHSKNPDPNIEDIEANTVQVVPHLLGQIGNIHNIQVGKNVTKVTKHRSDIKLHCEGTVVIGNNALVVEATPDTTSVKVLVPIDKDAFGINLDILKHLQSQIEERFSNSKDRIDVKLDSTQNDYVLISFDIKGAESQFEESAAWLAAKIKTALIKKSMELVDQSNTPLPVRVKDTSIQSSEEENYIVSISKGTFSGHKGENVILECVIVASSEVTSVEWCRLVDEEEIPLAIDNKKYLSGSFMSPSLVITNVKTDDEGTYFCRVLFDSCSRKSNITFLKVSNKAEEYVGRNISEENYLSESDGSDTASKGHEVTAEAQGISTDRLTFPFKPLESHAITKSIQSGSDTSCSFKSAKWFAGSISQQSAKNLLKWFPSGTYLCRIDLEMDQFCLHVKHEKGVSEYQVHRNLQNGYFLEKKSHLFPSILDKNCCSLYIENNTNLDMKVDSSFFEVMVYCLSKDLLDHYMKNEIDDGVYLLQPFMSNDDNAGEDESPLHLLKIAKEGNLGLFKEKEKKIREKVKIYNDSNIIVTVTDSDGRTLLQMACQSGNQELCMYLCMTYPTLLSKTDKFGNHCLHYLAISGSLNCYKGVESSHFGDKSIKEISNCYRNELKNKDGISVLNFACFAGNKTISMYLRSKYPDLRDDMGNSDNSLLYVTSGSESVICYAEIQDSLLNKKCRQQVPKTRGILKTGIQPGFQDICVYLCEIYPVLLSRKAKQSSRCLFYAAISGSLDCYKAIEGLVLHGKSDQQKQDYMNQLRTKEGQTILHWACASGCQHVCAYLSDNYPTLLSICDRQGGHCLHYAAVSGSLECYTLVEEIVLGSKTVQEKEHFMFQLRTTQNETVLHWACAFGCQYTCMYLGDNYPCLVIELDERGTHCLHYAAKSGCLQCFRTIEGFLPFVSTVKSKQLYICGFKTIEGQTVLHKACSSGSNDICMYLCQNYPDLLLEKDEQGYHCLHYAANFLSLESYKAIESLVLGEKPVEEKQQYMYQLKTNDQKTVLHFASLCCDRDRNNNRNDAYYPGYFEWPETIEGLGIGGNNLEVKRYPTIQLKINSWDTCKYLCTTYPNLMMEKDRKGCYFVHYLQKYFTSYKELCFYLCSIYSDLLSEKRPILP